MRTELLKKKTKSVCANITGGEVDSLRLKTETSSTVRVYDNGFIGIAGKIGDADEEVLKKEALSNLERKIPYPDLPDKPLYKSINVKKDIVSDEKFLPYVKDLFKRVAKENPAFIINGKAYLNELDSSYSSGAGRDLSYKGNSFELDVIFKDKASANIMDGSFAAEDDKLIGDDFAADVKTKLDAYLKQVPHVKEDKIPVIMSGSYFTFIIQHFIADVYCNGASLLNGKLKTKVFNDKFSALIDLTPEERIGVEFFDTEGVVSDDYKSYIVKNGIMEKLFTTKFTAQKYGVENLGSAYAGYADAPNLSGRGFAIERTADGLEDILKGREAIFLDVSSGGDMTPDGNMSLPSQLAFLYRDGKLVGRLPEFALCGNIFDVYGKDYLGACSLGSLFKTAGRETVVVAEMNVVNKK